MESSETKAGSQVGGSKGLAHAFIEAERETACRDFAVPDLVRIIATVDNCVLPALNRLFWDEWPCARTST